MSKEIKNVVIVPEDYTKKEKHYPVVYALHGYSGDYSSWIHIAPELEQKADELQIIIVCPDGGYRSWYLDSPIDTTFKYETYIIEELLPHIAKTYRTIDDKFHRAITGLSMGGHGALYLASKHTDLFGAAGSSSGGVDIRQYTASWDLKERILGDTICCKQNWEDNTVINVIDRINNKDLQLIIDCGIDDFFLTVNRNLHQKLLSKNIFHTYIEMPGEHNSLYWHTSIHYHLLFFSAYFNSNKIED